MITGYDLIQAINYWGLENCEVDLTMSLDALIFGVGEVPSETCTYYFDIEVPIKIPEDGCLHIWSMKDYEEHYRLKDVDDLETFVQNKIQEVIKSVKETGEWGSAHENEED